MIRPFYCFELYQVVFRKIAHLIEGHYLILGAVDYEYILRMIEEVPSRYIRFLKAFDEGLVYPYLAVEADLHGLALFEPAPVFLRHYGPGDNAVHIDGGAAERELFEGAAVLRDMLQEKIPAEARRGAVKLRPGERGVYVGKHLLKIGLAVFKAERLANVIPMAGPVENDERRPLVL